MVDVPPPLWEEIKWFSDYFSLLEEKGISEVSVNVGEVGRVGQKLGFGEDTIADVWFNIFV